MTRFLLTLLLAAAAAPALAQTPDPAPVYQPDKQYSFELKADGFIRQEWTESPLTFLETDRLLGRLRPRVDVRSLSHRAFLKSAAPRYQPRSSGTPRSDPVRIVFRLPKCKVLK